MSLIARLIEAGTPPELVEEVAMLVAGKRLAEEAIERRRSSDRDRQSRRRIDADNVTSRDITGQPVTERDPALSPAPNENNSNPHPHTHPENTIPRARKADPWPKPDCADPQHWADVKTNRKTKRLPNTPTAYAKFLRDLEKWVDDEWPPGRLIEAIAARGWASAEHDPRGTYQHGRSSPQRFSGNSTLRELAERSLANG